MNERCAQLLLKIISTDKPLKISQIADAFNVSPRTIRYDLDKIDEFLKDNNLPQLIRKPNLGVQFVESMEVKNRVLSLLEGITSYNYVLTPYEREKVILSELFRAKSYTTIEYLADLLSVSRGTVINDLKRVKKWLSAQNLKLESSPRYGLKIQGNEMDLRRAVITFLSENVEIEKALDILKAPVHRRMNVVMDEQVKKLFEDLDVRLIESAVRMAEEQLDTVFSDRAYSDLVIHLALAIKRIQLGKDITMPASELAELKLTKEFAVASSIAKNLEQNFGVKIPLAEIGYITIHLLGGKVTVTNAFMKKDWAKLQVLTAQIIQDIQRKIGTDFSSDDELYKGLMEHLSPTIYRLKHGLPLNNPLLGEIKNSYPGLFEAVKSGLTALESFVGRKVPDEEAGYIAVHFGAALERSKSTNRKVYRALVVCGTGVGTAKLLSSRIKAEFKNIEIIGTIASREVEKVALKDDVDLIISTVPTNVENLPEIVVNPLLPEVDVLKIKQYLVSHNPKNSCIAEKPKPLIEDLIGIIEKHCIIKSRIRLIEDLAIYLNVSCYESSKGVVQPVLKDLLTEKTIKLNVEAKDWEEAVRIGGEILVENGFVEPRYVDAMVKTVKEMGPYIVIAPGVAMPHARPEDGVKHVCMSLITLKNPVEFGNIDNDPVEIVICLGAVDNSTHLKALSDLMNLLNDDIKLDSIKKSKEIRNILDTIQIIR
ncbi:MAG: mannitol operon transcriptional activator [Thermoanaerobacteraceae bacterium]|nr:mannitol operon transcriptional activator [Thermoanaerobacteraceae bacterium]